jgi:hypothetical protein
MTAATPKAAVSWSSVTETSIRGLARVAIFPFCARGGACGNDLRRAFDGYAASKTGTPCPETEGEG